MLLKIIYLLISGHIGSLWLGSLSLAVESRGYSLAEVYGLPIVSVCPVAEHRRYSGGYSLVEVRGLLIVVASLVAVLRLYVLGLQ